MRLIDADALMEKYHKTPVWDSWVEINSAPTVDPESLRPHGRWTMKNAESHILFECSNCHNFSDIFVHYGDSTSAQKSLDFWKLYAPYCPKCGAKMKDDE